MEEYTLTLQLTVKVVAPDAGDALDVALDTFGPGSACGADVVEYEVLRIAEPK
ncbi:hypothetical protein SEA_MOAB_114 [Streptomyces phage Moab]|nr:hypothetical protein SEA_MOAB_114 [Streptomyces phage Moab]WMI33740.1 hypothetical protein SEA_PATELGO_115 [Streptomyces phage Patelgo]